MHKTAYAHSLDMATRNYFSHYTPENENIENRLNDNNIKYRAYGENIAGNISSVYRATDGWYNSTDHRNCMLYDFEYLGVGIAYNQYSKYKFYITQNYYTPS